MSNLISRAIHSFKKSFSQVPSDSFQFNSLQGSSAIDSSKAIEMIKSWVYISLDMNARMIASTPLRLYAVVPNDADMSVNSVNKVNETKSKMLQSVIKNRGIIVTEGEKIVEVLDHPSIELLHGVNKFRSYQSMIRETVWSLQGTGDSFWYVNRYIGGPLSGIPNEIWLLNPSKITVVPDKDEFIKGYLYQTGTGKMAIPIQNMIHLREPNLKNPFYGMGRIEAVWGAVQSYDSYQKYEINNSRNPIPAVVVSIKGQSLTPAQRRELLMEYDRLISNQGGVIRSNVLGIEDDSVEFKNLSFNPKDMQFIEGRKWNREEITNAFGQSVALFTDNASRANVDGALYRWSKFELDPDCSLIASMLTEQLLPMYDANVKLFFEFDTITKEDDAFLLQQEQSDRMNSIRSINEIRSSRGETPIKDARADDPFYSASSGSGNFTLSLDGRPSVAKPNNKTMSLRSGSSSDFLLEHDMVVSTASQGDM